MCLSHKWKASVTFENYNSKAKIWEKHGSLKRHTKRHLSKSSIHSWLKKKKPLSNLGKEKNFIKVSLKDLQLTNIILCYERLNISFSTNMQRQFSGERIFFSSNGTEQMDIHMLKASIYTFHHI